MKDIITIENVQRGATKMIPELKDLTYDERLRKLNLPTLVYRRTWGDMVETYKILNGKYDHNVSDFLCLHHQISENPDRVAGFPQILSKKIPWLFPDSFVLSPDFYPYNIPINYS